MTLAPVGVLRKRQSSLVREEFNGAALRREWAVTDPEGHFALGGGGLAFTPYSVPATWDQVMLAWSVRLAPLAGLAVEWAITFSNFGATAQDAASWGMDESLPALAYVRPGFTVLNTGGLQVRPHSSTPSGLATPVTLATGVEYRFRIQFLPVGSAYLISQDRGASWQVLWVDTLAQNPTKLFSPAFDNRSATGTLWSVRWWRGQALAPALSDTFAARTAPGRADTGQPWLVPPGRVPPLIAGDLRIPVGQIEAYLAAWDGIADGVWECDINFGSAPSTQKAVYLLFRFRDAANFMRITLQRVSQQIAVVRNVLNVPATLANTTAAGFLDNTTYHFTVVAVGPVIVVYQDGVEKLRFSEPFGQYLALSGWYLNDNLATPDIRMDNVRAWGFPARPLLMDSFDRPDSAVDIGRADTGQAYAPVTNIAGTPTWGIESGRTYLPVSPPGGDYLAGVPLSHLSLLASVVVRSLPGSQGVAGPVVRFIDGQNYVYVRLLFTTSTIAMFRTVAGVRTSLAGVAVAALNANQDYRVDVQMTGTTIEAYVDGTRYLSVSVLELVTAPGGGVYALNSLSRQDDLRVLPLGTAIVHDTFTRADSAAGMGNTEFPGTAWQQFVSGAGTTSTWGITGNKAYQVGNTGSPTFALSVVPTASSDVDLSARLSIGPGGGSIMGLVLRAIDKDNFISVRLDEGNDQVLLRKVVGGIGITPFAIPTPIATSTTYTLRVVAKGASLQVYLNGLPVLNTIEVDLLTAKLHGFFAAGGVVGTTFTWDDFLILEPSAAPVPPAAGDTFTRPDNAASLGNSEVPGTAWGGVGVWGVSAGQAYSLDTTTATKLALIPIAGPNARVEADVTFQVSTPGVALRATATGTDWLRAHLSGAFLNLFERVAGVTPAALAVVPPPGGWVAGQTRRLGLEATSAGLLRLFLDGGLVAAVPFTGHAGVTENGAGLLTAQNATTNRWDNFLASLVPVPGACPGIADDFARPDSIVSMGNTPAPWVAAWVLLNSGANWGISGGKAYSLDTSSTSRGAFVWHGLADFTVQADMTRAPSGTQDQVGFYLRCSASLSDYLYVRTGGITLAVIERVAAGAGVTVAAAAFVSTFGQTFRMRCVVKANVLQVFIDDVLLVTQAIVGHPALTEPYAGFFRSADVTGARYDNFSLLPIGGQPLVTDTFTRADSATTLGTTELPATPQPWSVVSGTWGIASNQAYSASDGSVEVALAQVPGMGDYAVQAVVSGQVRDGNNCRLPTLAVWYLDGNNVAFVDEYGGDLRLVSTVGGVAQPGATFPANLQDGVAYTLRAEVRAGSVAVYVDDVLRITYPLNAGEAALRATTNRAGLRLRKIGSPTLPARWDTFSIARLT